MSETRVQTIKIGDLQEPLLHSTVSSRYDISRLVKAARANPANLPGILVGTVGEKCYPMGRLDVLAACQAAGIQGVKANIRDYDSKLDLMTDQVREISVGEYIDPLRIRQVIDAFGRYGLNADDMLDMTNLAETQAARVALSFVTDDVLKALSDFVNNELSDKLPAASLVVPAHIILKIAKMESEMQAIIAKRVTELTIPQRDMNFAWPPPLSIAYEIRNMPKPERKSDAVVVKVTEIDDMETGDSSSSSSSGTKPDNAEPNGKAQDTRIPEKYAKAIEDLQVASKDCMIVLDKKGKPNLLVNKKNNTVKKISRVNDGKAFKLHADAAKPAFMMPIKTTRHLALDSRPMHGRDFDDAESSAEFCKTLKGQGLKVTVFWTTE